MLPAADHALYTHMPDPAAVPEVWPVLLWGVMCVMPSIHLLQNEAGLSADGVCCQGRVQAAQSGGNCALHCSLCVYVCDAAPAAPDIWVQLLLLLLGGLCTAGDVGVTRNMDLVTGWSATV